MSPDLILKPADNSNRELREVEQNLLIHWRRCGCEFNLDTKRI